jgi:L-rhamnonate dehydratase
MSDSTQLTRRRIIAAAAFAPPLFAAPDRITAVDAWSSALLPVRAPAAPRFASDDDPARRRWFGPFAQLTSAILVRIRTAAGLTGYGLGGGGGAAVYLIEKHLRDLLLGVNPANVETLWDQLYEASAFYGRRGLTVMAISGIDNALWDLAGKAAGKPVCELAGGRADRKIAAYYTGNNLDWAVEQGFRAFKLPVSDGPPQGRAGMDRMVKQVAAARQRIGPEADLMIDCLGRWTVPYTLEMVERLAGYRLRWIEEPLMPDDLDGYAELCRTVRGPRIASGEHEYTRYGFAELLRRKAVQVAQPDPTWSGGFSELRRIAALARAAGVPVAPHRGGSLYGLHFIVATPECDLAESFGLGEKGTEMMQAMTPRFERGFLTVPPRPGFGAEIDEKWLERLPRY